jgi:hypothetical protein
MSAELARLDAERLADLRYHWRSAYYIVHFGRTWLAWWRDGPRVDLSAELEADTAAELRLLIRADYDRRTMPHE